MKIKSFIFAVAFILFFFCLTVFALEIPYPEEKGFFVGVELPYQTVNSKQEKQEGIFVFGQSKIILSGKEYFDCVFFATTKEYHFYFAIDPNKQSLLFKGLKMGISEINTNQPATSLAYPLFPSKKWSEEKIEIAGKNIEIPGLGVLPSLTVKNVKATSTVFSCGLSVPAGIFETLLIETTFSGDVLNIPVSIVQRTWLDKRNIILKMSFEFQFLTKITPIFDMELLQLVPAGFNQQSKTICWASIKGG